MVGLTPNHQPFSHPKRLAKVGSYRTAFPGNRQPRQCPSKARKMAMASFGSGSVLLGDFLVYYFKGIKKR